MTNWMLVSNAGNFEVARQRGFDLAAMKSRHRKKAEKVVAGDRVLFYIVGIQRFGGTATATGPYFESAEPLFTSKNDDPYPFRFPIEPNVILQPEQFVSAFEMLPQLEWVKKWPVAHWQLAFQGNVHVLSDQDFGTIEAALRAAQVPEAAAR